MGIREFTARQFLIPKSGRYPKGEGLSGLPHADDQSAADPEAIDGLSVRTKHFEFGLSDAHSKPTPFPNVEAAAAGDGESAGP